MQIKADIEADTLTLILTIPKAKITETMSKDFKCSAKVNNDFVVEASGTAQKLSILKQPAKSGVFQGMEHVIDCSIVANSEVGTVQWYRETRDTATTPSSFIFAEYKSPANTVAPADTEFTSKITFESISEDDTGFYRCKVTYEKTDTFPGGTVLSEIGSINVVTLGKVIHISI